MRRRVDAARVGRLATVSAAGQPHLVPVCFALVGEIVYSTVDTKPKRSKQLRRVDNARATGVATLLVDQYTEDWASLWWVRVDGRIRLVEESGNDWQQGLAALADKYHQYRLAPPPGPVLALDTERWSGWEADPRPSR